MTDNLQSTKNKVFAILLMAMIYASYGSFVFGLKETSGQVVQVLFIPEGLALALVLCCGPWLSMGVFMGQALLSLSNGASVETSLGLGLVNGTEMLIAYTIVKRENWNLRFDSVQQFLGFSGMVLLVLQPFSSFFGNLVVSITVEQSIDLNSENLFRWWASNSMAQVFLAPALLQITRKIPFLKSGLLSNIKKLSFYFVIATPIFIYMVDIFNGDREVQFEAAIFTLAFIFYSRFLNLASISVFLIIVSIIFGLIPHSNNYVYGLSAYFIIAIFVAAQFNAIMELETSSLIEQEASIFNAIPIGIAIVVDGVVATVNKAMEEIFENISDIGHIKAGGLWMKYYSSIPWSSRIHFKQTEAKYYSASQELVFDNGEINRTFNVSSFAIDGTENGAIWIFQDNTFEKEKNIKIAQMHDIAEMESQRKSVFMANLSHDLRTPIHGILGILNSIQKNQYPHELQKKLQLLNHSAEYIQAVVDDGLDLSANDLGLGKDQLNIISIDSLIGKIKVLEEDKVVSKGLNFVIKKIAPPDVFIKIQVTKMLRVVCNLIDNAYKFTNSGSITVVLCLYNLNANSDLEIRIIDTGTGLRRGTDESDMLDDSDIQNVPSGYGLGMAIVNDLLKKLNGSMELVRSNSGGTEFMLHFPVAIHNPSATPRLSSAVIHDDPDNISMPSGLRILVAEDNRISRFVIEDQLNDIYSDCGVEISIVTNGREAFEKWQSWRPSIILMDIQMPVLDGEQAARKIRAAQQLEGNDTQAVILVATTAHTFIEEQQRLLYGDFDLMLTKPMTPDQLRSVLQHSVKKLKDLGLH